MTENLEAQPYWLLDWSTSVLLCLAVGVMAASVAGADMQNAEADSAGSLPAVSTNRLIETVIRLVGGQSPRNYLHPEVMSNTADYCRGQLAAAGASVQEQWFEATGRRFCNVIGSLATNLESRVIVGAHYDVCGDQPGADDNASGVAGVLELARLLKPQETNLKYRVDLVCYALEEPPFFRSEQMGSYVHAQSLCRSNAQVRGMIALEMIGFFSDAPKSQGFPLGIMKWFYATTGNFIGVVGNRSSRRLVREVAAGMEPLAIGVETLVAPAWVPGVDLSDHRNYWKFKWPAVMITDTAFYRNHNYHDTADTIDTLDFTRMAEVVKGLANALLKLE